MRKFYLMFLAIGLCFGAGAADAAIMQSNFYVVNDNVFLMGPDPALFAIGDEVRVVADVNGSVLNSFYYEVESSISGTTFSEHFDLSNYMHGVSPTMIWGVGMGSGLDTWAWSLSDNFFTRNYQTSTGSLLQADGFNFNAAPVPVPAALWLLGSGLVGLAGIRKRMVN